MPILAFNSTSILDSTSIGRDLLTAADQAAAQATIGVTPFDVDADHDWGGFNTFEFLATFEGGINTTAITSSANVVTTMPSGGQGQYYFGANPIYLMSATEFRPAEVGTSATLGSATRRWTDVYGVDGNFSGTVTTNTITSTGDNLSFQRNGGLAIAIGGTFIQCYKDIRPASTGLHSNGTDALRWSDVYSVDGSFTGNLTSEVGGSYKLYNLGDESAADSEYYEASWDSNNLKMYAKATGAGVVRNIQFGSANVQIDAKPATNQIVFRTAGEYRMQINNIAIISTVDVQPSVLLNGTLSNGSSTARWSDVYSVDGNFSRNITAENLPTSDPGVPGQFYVTTGGALKVSQ